MYRVAWIQGTKYVEGCVVVLDSSEVLPTFGVIINVLLIYFKLKNFLHTVVQRDKPIPIVYCKPDELSDQSYFRTV